MPEQLRALVVLAFLASAAFVFAKPVITFGSMSGDDFARRRDVWLAITVLAFLSHSFWVFLILVVAVLIYSAKREPNKIALYFFLLFAVPGLTQPIPGLGVVNYLFDINYYRVLAIVLFLPVFLQLHQDKSIPRFGALPPDLWLGGYLVLQFCLMMTVSTVTNTVRVSVFYAFTDVFLPYYAISRSVRSIESLREALAAFSVAALVMCPVAVFEALRHWLLYASVGASMGIESDVAVYLERGDGGLLRALASAGHPIALGFVMMVALALFHSLKPVLPSWRAWVGGMALLAGGLAASVSRGPWIGSLAVLLVFLATGTSAAKHLIRYSVLGAIAVAILLLSPAADLVVGALPLSGSMDDTTAYRVRLIEVSLELIFENPFFGAYDYIYSSALEEMRQGQGIIDIVNTYLAIALSSGLVGAGLFLGFFLSLMSLVFRAMRVDSNKNSDLSLIGRALFAAIAGILVTIGTVSSVMVIPKVYWALAGLCAGYAEIVVSTRVDATFRPVSGGLTQTIRG